MENKNDMMFERLGDLRPHKSRLNLDSFTNFSDPEKEKNLELKKQLLLKKIDILKSLDGEERELDETFNSLAEVFGIGKDILIKAHSKGEGSRGGKVIGHTVNGKPIYKRDKFEHFLKVKDYVGRKHKDFNQLEHLEAAKFHDEKGKEADEKINRMLENKKYEDFTPKERRERQLLDNESYAHHFYKEAHRDFAEMRKNEKKNGIEKAHSSFPIGTIHNGYKKIAEGIWRKVSQYGLTKKDHERLGRGEDIVGISYPKWIKREELERQKRVHQKEAEKLNNKNYSDEDVIKKEKEEKKKSLPEKGTPEWHELQIAKKTMKMNDVGAMIMGGQTKEEARKILKEYGLEKSNEDDLEKGLINDLSYSWNGKEGGFSFNKTGKEIKAQLPALIATLKQQYDALVLKQAALVEEIGEEPTEERTYFERNFSFKSYPYEAVYENSNPNGRTEEQKLMQCYNDNLYKLCDIQRDIKVGEVMERNLDDKKKYSLSLSQAADLGF